MYHHLTEGDFLNRELDISQTKEIAFLDSRNSMCGTMEVYCCLFSSLSLGNRFYNGKTKARNGGSIIEGCMTMLTTQRRLFSCGD